MRVGIGYDIHRLKKGRKLILGGLEIPYHFDLLGHSDGDVILHSLSDAILGALGLPDIGVYFPDTEEKYKDMDSQKILKKVSEERAKKKSQLVNIDIVLLAEEPKLSPYYEKIKANLSRLTGLKTSNIGLKVKTMEGLSSLGAKKTISCLTIVQLR